MKTPQFYCASSEDDFQNALTFMKQEGILSNEEDVFAVGFSLGGNILGRFLAKEMYNAPFKKAICVCPPIDLKASSENIESKLWGAYSRALADYMKEAWETHRMAFRHF